VPEHLILNLSTVEYIYTFLVSCVLGSSHESTVPWSTSTQISVVGWLSKGSFIIILGVGKVKPNTWSLEDLVGVAKFLNSGRGFQAIRIILE